MQDGQDLIRDEKLRVGRRASHPLVQHLESFRSIGGP
jgi:hypothetical protein